MTEIGSTEHGFVFTEEHAAIEGLIDRGEAGTMTHAEVMEALRLPFGRMSEHPAVQRVLRSMGRDDLIPPPKLTLIQGGRDA